MVPPFAAMRNVAVVMLCGNLLEFLSTVRAVAVWSRYNRSLLWREASSVLLLKVTSRMNISSRTVESEQIHYVEVENDRQAIELGISCKTTHQRVDVALLKR